MQRLAMRAPSRRGLYLTTIIAGLATPAAAQVEEILVTAQKRAESIQDVPISITAFTGEFMEKNGIDDVRDVMLFTPNFNVTTQNSIGNTHFIIRGVGSDGNSGIEPSVAVFVDGVYIPRSAAVLNSLLDLKTFEVLRGPQGTLFGRNTPMGALNLTTRAPTQEFDGYLQVTGGNHSQRAAKGYVNGGISDNLAGRFSFYIDDRSGFTDNVIEGDDTNDRKEFGGRLKLLWSANDRLDLTLSADYARIDGGFGEAEFVNLTPNFVTTIENTFSATITDTKLDHLIENSVDNDFGIDENWGVNLRADWQVAGHSLVSITAYREWDNRVEGETLHIPVPLLELNRPQGVEQFSEEIQILSATDQKLEYVGGLFFYHEEYFLQDFFTALPDLCRLSRFQPGGSPARVAACPVQSADRDPEFAADFNTNLDSFALFGQATYHVTDKFSVTGGVRWTRDDKKGSYLATTSTTTDFIFAADFTGDRVDKKATWLVNARYFVNDDIMLFSTVSTGFKSGGFNGRTNASLREFGPEKTRNHEVGVKATVLDGRLLANLTLYRTRLEDFQDSVSLSQSLAFNVQNAGNLRVQGVEFDFQANPVPPLVIEGGLAYLDSEFLDFVGASVPAGLGLGALPTIVLSNGVLVQDLTGQRRQESPQWQASLSATWTQTLPGSSSLLWFVRPEWHFVDEQFLSGELDPVSLEPSRSIVGLRFGIGDVDDKWRVTAWSQNLLNEHFCTSRFDQPLGGLLGATRVHRCNLGDPRTFGVTGTLRF